MTTAASHNLDTSNRSLNDQLLLSDQGLAKGDEVLANDTALEQTVCFHCLEPLPEFGDITAEVDDTLEPMCCIGCKAAAEFIDSQGLTKFYQHRKLNGGVEFFDQAVRVDVANQKSDKWRYLDSQGCDVIYTNREGHRELTLYVEGLYCSSCSWLISSALQNVSDAVELSIDVVAKRVHLRVKDSLVSIAMLLATIESLGYQPRINHVGGDQDTLELERADRHQSIKRIVVAGFGTMQVMTYAMASYLGAADSVQPEYARFLTLISMLVATVVVFYSGKPFFVNALNDISNRHIGMDVPIAIAIAAAYFPSVYQTLVNSAGHVYFDSAVMFVFFLSLGRFIEMRARHKLNGSGSELNGLLPDQVEVQRWVDKRQINTVIEPRNALIGDQVSVNVQDIIPFDCTVIEGQGSVDEALISGESKPLDKTVDSQLFAGSRLLSGSIVVQVSHAWSDSSLAHIERLLQGAQRSETSDNPANRMSSQTFIVAVLIVTLLVACGWMLIDPSRVFEICLAMLVASCPCAFALAEPIGRSAALHALRRAGLLITHSRVLDVAQNIGVWCFDKTGTLTRGAPTIVDVRVTANLSQTECLHIAASLEQQSQHVLSKAFEAIQSEYSVESLEELDACGVHGSITGNEYWLGKRAWVLSHLAPEAGLVFDEPHVPSLSQNTVMVLANRTQVLAVFSINDSVRSTVRNLFSNLIQQGSRVCVLSGDSVPAVKAVCATLPTNQSLGNLMPGDKVDELTRLQQEGNTVAMVGDGVNDAPVLRHADVSIAMAQGSELSQQNADVIVINGRLDSLALLAPVSQLTYRITQQNLRWAIGYNALALPLAAFGFLTPWIAAIGMSLSSLLVVVNALRISRSATRLNSMSTDKIYRKPILKR